MILCLIILRYLLQSLFTKQALKYWLYFTLIKELARLIKYNVKQKN